MTDKVKLSLLTEVISENPRYMVLKVLVLFIKVYEQFYIMQNLPNT